MEILTRPAGRTHDQHIFKLLRVFSAFSLAAILLAVGLLTLLYRQVAIGDLIHSGERGNQLLAQSFLNAVHAPLLAYLENEDHHHGLPFPAKLEQSIAELMHDTGVTRVKIYDDEGIILYSTAADQIGTSQHDNPHVQSGLKGQISSELIYRDRLNPFDQVTDFDNVIQTYIPIRQDNKLSLGVFEVNGDLTPLVRGIERAELLILGGSTVILLMLYFFLLAIVRHAACIIAEQQDIIRERSHALELLSTQLIDGQEEDKKHLAVELHEGIAQILSSIKYQMEHACRPNGLPCPNDYHPLDELVPAIQSTIQEIRTLAMDLRPSSLDDLGLLPTLDWYGREFRSIYPDIDLVIDKNIDESDLPRNIKVILFRLIQLMLQRIARMGCANQISIVLSKSVDRISLEVSDDCPISTLNHEQRMERDQHLLTLRERVALAGGDLEIPMANASPGTTMRAT